ncbi:glycosyltransferase [Roseisolibacter sp. H3M3-2]|uniref:glycosyltransferase n=1 Tax=Roseisolibacter sp. H3M3-2 TaxID=3031323 RepID=UPI0023DB19BD|nr:glycosyltransferase [Roseisolibacter sp. H3M3-2]MDF1506092.1 glycosyltransferase [Roseisolibacter sp. H3M3-2]
MPDPAALLPWLAAAGDAFPWLAGPLVVWWRGRDSRSLDDYPAALPAHAPLVSVVVPARDEARNVGRCVASVLATRWPHLELLVVDDHSTDGTADVARAAAAGDPRLRILDSPPLPAGWMGKQWACATGAAAARGDVLCFADADTAHAPDLLPRALRAIHDRRADLLSVAGRQEMDTFWEKVVQPQVFAVIAGRFGGTERVSRSRNAVDKIANGQCLLMTRAAYDRVGGHGAVRDAVAEDLKMAQRTHEAGLSVHLLLGEAQLSTRMYTSLRELVVGWRKNVFAGGREAMPLGRLGQWIFPLLLLLPALLQLYPLGILLAARAGWLHDVTIIRAAFISVAATLLFWAATYRRAGLSPLWALAFPLGAGTYLTISLQAIARGRRVEWRGREYVSASGAA